MNAVTLTCDLCTLRAPTPSDAASLSKHANDRDVWINLRDGFPHPYTIEAARRYIEMVADQNPRVSFAIDVDGVACGGMGLHVGRDIESVAAEAGYWLGKEYWGRGIATAALKMLCEYAFGTLRLRRIFALPIAWNQRSFRVLEKAGFGREGTLRNACLKDGKVADMVMYSRIS